MYRQTSIAVWRSEHYAIHSTECHMTSRDIHNWKFIKQRLV